MVFIMCSLSLVSACYFLILILVKACLSSYFELKCKLRHSVLTFKTVQPGLLFALFVLLCYVMSALGSFVTSLEYKAP